MAYDTCISIENLEAAGEINTVLQLIQLAGRYRYCQKCAKEGLNWLQSSEDDAAVSAVTEYLKDVV
ncbi:MAG: hypothetical protein ACP5N7_06480 [Candidatus Pacearchaeota archaeon]